METPCIVRIWHLFYLKPLSFKSCFYYRKSFFLNLFYAVLNIFISYQYYSLFVFSVFKHKKCISPDFLIKHSLKGTVKEKWKGVYDETWESQALNDTYRTSIWCSCLELKLCTGAQVVINYLSGLIRH